MNHGGYIKKTKGDMCCGPNTKGREKRGETERERGIEEGKRRGEGERGGGGRKTEGAREVERGERQTDGRTDRMTDG